MTTGVRAIASHLPAVAGAEAELRELARLQASVAYLGARALGGAELRDVLDEAVLHVAEALGVELAAVLEWLPAGTGLLLRAGAGWRPGAVGHAALGRGAEEQAARALLAREPVVVAELAADPRLGGVALLREEGVVSLASVLVLTHDGPYGTLAALSRGTRAFGPDELHYLEAVAHVLGADLDRHRGDARMRRIVRVNHALRRCNGVLIRASDEAALLREICEVAVEEAGYRLCWAGRAEHDAGRSVVPVAQAGHDDGYLRWLHVTWADVEHGRGPTGTSIRTRRIQVVHDIATDPRMQPWRAEAARRGYASIIAIPLVVDGEVWGALTIYSGEPEAFDGEEVALLEGLAQDLAFGIGALRARAERVLAEAALRRLNAELEARVSARTAELELAREREAEVGFRIQAALLMESPPRDVRGVEVAALTLPSRGVDGDFYAFANHRDRVLDVVVGDVMGKGVPAALLGAATKTRLMQTLRELGEAAGPGGLPAPREVVALAHAGLVRHLLELESFVTLCYARIDAAGRRLDLVDCGHTGLVHWRAATGRVGAVHGTNLPLGVREGELYDQLAVRFEPGDLFLLFSDGVTEARDAAGELYGPARLHAALRARARLPLPRLVAELRDEVLAFAAAPHPADDLTLVAVRVQDAPAPLAHASLDLASELAQLHAVREAVRAFCRGLPGAPLAEERTADLVLAVDEAVSNVMRHAYRGRTDQPVHVELTGFADRVVVRLHHVGIPFDPAAAPRPPGDARESGQGTVIMARAVDELCYTRDDRGCSCVVLTKLR